MKVIIVALALVAIAAAATVPEEVKIVRSDFKQDPAGPYSFDFESDDGISRQEVGELKEALDEENKPHSVITVRGQFTYKNQDGKIETVNYYADETGFHAEGDSIPKPVQARR